MRIALVVFAVVPLLLSSDNPANAGFLLNCRFAHSERIVPVSPRILIPFGAPVALPPCILHLPFFIAPLRQGLPVLREWAPHLGLWCMGNLCMGLFL